MENNLKSKPLIEDAYRKIKGMIFDQKLVPGQKLVYQDLVTMLKMSQTPIINALNRLEQDGFVASENFRGFYVKPIDLEEVWENFGVREAIEVYAVKQAILVGSSEEMRVLEQRLREHGGYVPEHYTKKKFHLDSEFHLQIAEMAKNHVLKYLLRRNLEHIYLRARLDDYDPQRMASSAREHRELLERMKKRDIIGSIETMQHHIQIARDHVIRCLSGPGSDEEEYGYI